MREKPNIIKNSAATTCISKDNHISPREKSIFAIPLDI